MDYNFCSLKTIKAYFSEYGFGPSKLLGQNFLINKSIISKIVSKAGVGNCFVLEVGPGFGALTKELAKEAKKVCAIEKDWRLIPILKKNFCNFDNVEIINGDVLKLDLNEIIKKKAQGLEVKICANLPYYITSPFLMAVLEKRIEVKAIVVMVQKEAANRLCAAPGSNECGAISYAIDYYSFPRQLFSVSKGSFFPEPKVNSSVISLKLRSKPCVSVLDEVEFFKLIRAAFSKRRKILLNPLSEYLGVKKKVLEQILESLNISKIVRPQELTLFQFSEIFNLVFKFKKR